MSIVIYLCFEFAMPTGRMRGAGRRIKVRLLHAYDFFQNCFKAVGPHEVLL